MKKGFTLIELLIVVAIIGILAAIGAALIPRVLEDTKTKVVKQNCSQVIDFIKITYIQYDSVTTQMFHEPPKPYRPPTWGNCKERPFTDYEFRNQEGGQILRDHFNCIGYKNPITGNPGVTYNSNLNDPCENYDAGMISINTKHHSSTTKWVEVLCCGVANSKRERWVWCKDC